MQELQSFFEECGYTLSEPMQLDGKLHRFSHDGSKDAGWYIGWLHPYLKKEGSYPIAVIGDWKTGSKYTYAPGNLSREDKRSSDAKIHTAQKLFQKEKSEKNEEAALKASNILERGRTEGEHPYLKKKLLSGLFGAVLVDDRLCVPMRDMDGKLWGMQYIFADGGKKFISGQKSDLCFHVIGASRVRPGMILCEGFATGASIHMATGEPVVVTFSASNLLKLAKLFAASFPYGSFRIAGDDDRFTAAGNAGRKAADEASELLQCPVSYPVFASDDDKPTDFNDLHVREGIDSVARQMKSLRMPSAGFRPLGTDESGFFFYHVMTALIVKIPTTFSRNHMLKLAPLSYWQKRYRDEDTGKMDWLVATNDLIDQCNHRGPFKAANVRGLGVWIDGDDVVVNEGDRLLVNGVITAFSNRVGEYFYVSSEMRMRTGKPLTVAECEPLLELCGKLNWQDESSGFILAGWIVASMISGALPLRPHIALSGPSGAGKSTILNGIVMPCLGPSAIFATGATTEAGIRQTMRGSSIPVVLDEFEGNTESAKVRVDAVLELLRSAHSSSGGRTLKGSLTGSSDSYTVSFCALVAGINLKITESADLSRFTMLDLQKRGNSPEQYEPIRTLLYMITPEFGERLRGRAVKNLSKIMASYEILSKAFQEILGDMRLGQQMGIIYASLWSLMSDEIVGEAEAKVLASTHKAGTSEEEVLSDEEECLRRLLTTTVKITLANGFTSERTIGHIIAEGTDHDHNQLKKFGLHVIRSKGFYVANRHAYLETKIYANTRWTVWKNSLKRLDGAKVDQTVRFELPTKCVLLPMRYVKEVNEINDVTDF